MLIQGSSPKRARLNPHGSEGPDADADDNDAEEAQVQLLLSVISTAALASSAADSSWMAWHFLLMWLWKVGRASATGGVGCESVLG